GREIGIGNEARLKIVKRIERCAATNVDPDTGIRDLAIPHTLMRTFGHGDCGIYGEVTAGGTIAIGDQMGEVRRRTAVLLRPSSVVCSAKPPPARRTGSRTTMGRSGAAACPTD